MVKKISNGNNREESHSSERLLVLIGPTAVGKTALSIELAQRLEGEIISGDSMQVYKYLDIGTAKIKPHETKGIPHHLIDIKEPDESFSVAEFQELAREKISEISRRGRLPILTGGTGLYIQAVLDKYEFGPRQENRELREELQLLAEDKGLEYLHQKLQQVDPQSGSKLHPHDLKRIIRALEYYQLTGKPISANQSAQDMAESSRYNTLLIGLNMDRQRLYRRIDNRVEQMMAEGFLAEVQRLLEAGYNSNCQALQGLGYKQLVAHLQGELSLQEAIELIKRDTRRFAKRQLTWFRRDPRIHWFDAELYPDKGSLAEEILANFGRTICFGVE